MHETAPSTSGIRRSSRTTLAGVGVALGIYLAALLAGAPQHGRDLLVAAQASHGEHAAKETGHETSHAVDPGDHGTAPDDNHAAGHDDHGDEASLHAAGPPPPAWAVTPFLLLLGAIAVLPLIPALAHWWEHNSSKLLVAGSLGLITLGYYLVLHNAAIE